MPLLKSAIKRMRQNSVRRDRRKPIKSLMKTMVKTANDAASSKKLDAKQLATSYKAIDMAAKKGIIHKKTASRKKSSLAKLLTK
jgi:small subunit ribosomal protein S20